MVSVASIGEWYECSGLDFRGCTATFVGRVEAIDAEGVTLVFVRYPDLDDPERLLLADTRTLPLHDFARFFKRLSPPPPYLGLKPEQIEAWVADHATHTPISYGFESGRVFTVSVPFSFEVSR